MFHCATNQNTPADSAESGQPQARLRALQPSTTWTAPTREMWPANRAHRVGSEPTITPTTGRTEWFNPAPPAPFERHEVELRHRVAHHLRRTNAQHVIMATDKARAGERPLAAHGVSLFYAGRDPHDPFGFRLYTMSRWGYSNPENDDLAHLLQGLDETARGFMAAAAAEGRQWDPRGPDHPLVNIGDFPLSPASAHYVGMAVQTLDTDRGRWTDVVDGLVRMEPTAAALALRDVPREAAALLVDGSALRVVNDHDEPTGYDAASSRRTQPTAQSHDAIRAHSEQFGATLRRAWPYLNALSLTLQHCSAHRQV